MPDDHPSPDQILSLFRASGAPLSAQRARRLAEEIAAHGGLDSAIAALDHDQAYQQLDDALAYRALLSEAEVGAQAVIDRLLRQARDLDARADPAWAEAADLRGKAAYRSARGEPRQALWMQAQASAAERFAADLEEQAFRLRLDAARRQAAASVCAILLDVAA
jgi:hypothetical protein